MFARITKVQIKSNTLEETEKIYRESVIPAAKAQKGYQRTYMLADRKTGKGMAFTLWDSEEDAIANEQSGYYREQLDKFKDVFAAPPIREGYEVIVQG
jgi:heme-degrading monooxygenase HmoA